MIDISFFGDEVKLYCAACGSPTYVVCSCGCGQAVCFDHTPKPAYDTVNEKGDTVFIVPIKLW